MGGGRGWDECGLYLLGVMVERNVDFIEEDLMYGGGRKWLIFKEEGDYGGWRGGV